MNNIVVWLYKLLNFYGFDTQVPNEEPALALDIYPLMTDYNRFFVGGALWSSHRE
jgi:hypothetical protein